jgi:predicted transcriptional regulator YheO
MKEIIAESVQRFGKPVSAMGKEEKIHAVDAMMQRGLFIVKGGVERAASALGVTRFTIYNYFDALRQRSADTSLLPEGIGRRPVRK